MSRHPLALPLIAALGLVAGCAAGGGDPQKGSDAAAETPLTAAAQAPLAGATAAPIEARDVAVLVLEQTPSSLRVTSSARRPRSSFGPSAAWNGAGAPTHRWELLGARGEELASGDIVAHSALEVPPNPAQGAPGARVEQSSFAFTARVPQPGPGEAITITDARSAALTVRWP
jgi:hypothetical protein